MSSKQSSSLGSASGSPKGGPSAADIARRIQRMAVLLRNAAQPLMGQRPAKARQPGDGAGQRQGKEVQNQAAGKPVSQTDGQPVSQTGWWVLAQGRILDPEDFSAREAAREDLLVSVRQAGVLVGENVWVWDETGRAQLVLTTLPTLERARRVAERLREKGLNITVRREMP